MYKQQQYELRISMQKRARRSMGRKLEIIRTEKEMQDVSGFNGARKYTCFAETDIFWSTVSPYLISLWKCSWAMLTGNEMQPIPNNRTWTQNLAPCDGYNVFLFFCLIRQLLATVSVRSIILILCQRLSLANNFASLKFKSRLEASELL